MTYQPDLNEPLDVWLKFDDRLLEAFGYSEDDDPTATHEANTYRNTDGTYRVEWYLNSVGLVTTVEFATLDDAHVWYEREGFIDFSS